MTVTVAACGGEAKQAVAAKAQEDPKTEAAENPEPAQKDPDPAPAEKQEQEPAAGAPSDTALASGLPTGDKFKAFQIVNCDSGDEYCQVCKFGSSPKIMAAGTLDDEEFKEDLKNIDAIVAKYGDDKVKAFAVIGEIKDGKLATPVESREELQAKAKKLRAELEINMPVVIPAAEDGSANATWEEHYKVTKSRTLMFADGRNEVKYSQVAPSDLGALDEAIKAVLQS